MFVRRLAFLSVAALVSFVVLGAQLVRLAVVEHDAHRGVAERRLDRVEFIPTHRGQILDRKGRVLAEDRPSWDVAMEYDFIGGAWAVRHARAAAREALGATRWSELSAAARGEAIEERLAGAEARGEWVVRAVCELCAMDRAQFEVGLDEIRRRVQERAVAVWDRQRELEMSRHVDGDERFVPRPIREQTLAHVVVAAVPEVVAFELQRIADQVPGVLEVRESSRRENPLITLDVDLDRSTLPRGVRTTRPLRLRLDGVADHILGELRDSVWPSDLRRRPFLDDSGGIVDLGGYRPGLDRIGSRGIEAAQEDRLRGSRGVIRTRLDGGSVSRVEAQPGGNVQLTLDIELQAMVQGILDPRFGLMRTHAWQTPTDAEDSGDPPDGRELLGAAVVIDVESGEILAAVSRPTIAEGLRFDAAQRQIALPYVNRPFESPYPPGSILKPLIYLGAVDAKAFSADQRIACRGHFLPDNPHVLRCWIYRERTGFATHEDRTGGALDATDALARSCNIFFYTAAARLGPPRLVPWLRRIGIGAPLDTGLLVRRESAEEGGAPSVIGEHGGFLPDEERIGTTEAALIGIGQGPVAWTPLMAANAFATLARGGILRDATIVRGHGAERAARSDLRFDPGAVRAALRGLREVVSAEHGTATSIRYEDGSREPIIDQPGLVVWAKTGTVQTGISPGGANGRIAAIDHAWFVGLVGGADERPRYAISVMVEHGRSGGRTAGPIFNQIIHALRRLGYLPAAPTERGEA